MQTYSMQYLHTLKNVSII